MSDLQLHRRLDVSEAEAEEVEAFEWRREERLVLRRGMRACGWTFSGSPSLLCALALGGADEPEPAGRSGARGGRKGLDRKGRNGC